MDVYYCGFNGFQQVPNKDSDSPTFLTSLTVQSKNIPVLDVAICWNFLVVVEADGVTKYGLAQREDGTNNRIQRLSLPSGCGHVVQLSATPRHLLAVTESGETWTHEEGKGWRRVCVESRSTKLDEIDDSKKAMTTSTSSSSNDDINNEFADLRGDYVIENEETPIRMVKTSCGDNYNLGLDSNGNVYSLPSLLDFDPGLTSKPKVTDIACGKEHNLLLTEHGQVYSWGGGSRGQLGHGSLNSEDRPRLITALDGMKIRNIAAGGWHSAVVSVENDLYTFGWNESGQLAQATNLVKPAECFSAVEKLLMACCTMQPEDAAIPRGDAEDGDVYRKPGADDVDVVQDPGKDDDPMTACYGASACNREIDFVTVQSVPSHVPIPGKTPEESDVLDVGCGSRHTVVLTKSNTIWAFGWNKYGQLGLGHTASKDTVEKVQQPKSKKVQKLICGDWGTAIIVKNEKG